MKISYNLPDVENLQDLSNYLRLSESTLYKLSTRNNTYYKIFEIPKSGRKKRTIYAPSRMMKAVQAWILHNILYKIPISDAAKGFRQKKNTRNNVEPHKNNRYFLCLDIENFFPSIPYRKVYTVFNNHGYPSHISHIFASLCTCKKKLPQGGVTSPALSNIVCRRLDRRLSSFLAKYRIVYTRYADDMSFSSGSPGKLNVAKEFVTHILPEEGFQLNQSKTRFMGPRSQRKVTGLVIGRKPTGEVTIGIGRKQKRTLRSKIHHFYTDEHLSQEKQIKLKQEIQGWFAYMNSVDQVGLKQMRQYNQHLQDKYDTSKSIE